jgi:hypothetical protein
MVLARRSAINATKQQLRSQCIKPQLMLHKDIVAMANDYVVAHPELITEAKERRPRVVCRSPDPQGLSLCETHAQNGATQ